MIYDVYLFRPCIFLFSPTISFILHRNLTENSLFGCSDKIFDS